MEIQESVLLRRVGRMDPVSVPELKLWEDFQAYRKALSMEKEELLKKSAQPKGQGGAGYPAGGKRKSLYRIEGDTKYIVRNALLRARTFKDRCCWKKRP